MKHYEVSKQQVGVVVESSRVSLTIVAAIPLRLPFGLQGGGGASVIV